MRRNHTVGLESNYFESYRSEGAQGAVRTTREPGRVCWKTLVCNFEVLLKQDISEFDYFEID